MGRDDVSPGRREPIPTRPTRLARRAAGVEHRTAGAGRGARRCVRRRNSSTVGGRIRGVAGALSLALASWATAGEAAGESAGGPAGEAQAALRLTLDEAVRFALRNNRTILSARHRRRTQKLSLEVAEDRYRPRVSIGSSVREQRQGETSADVSIGPSIRIPTGGALRLAWSQPLAGGAVGGGGWTLEFSQPLLKGFGADIDTAPNRIARINEKKNLLGLRDTIARTIASVVRNYHSLVRAHRALEIGRNALSRTLRQLETNRSLVRIGRMAANDVIPTEAAVADRRIALSDGENRVVAANAALVSVLDIDTESQVHPAQALPQVGEVRLEPETSLATAFANRSDYIRALMDRETARIRLREAKDNRRWDLKLQATMADSRGGESDHAIGLGLAIALGDRSPELGVLRAMDGLRDAEMAIVELRESIHIQVHQAIHDAAAGFRRVELARRARELARQNVDVEREKLARGLTSTVQMGTVEDALVRAQTGELDSVIAYFNALASLDQRMGTTLQTWGIDLETLDSSPVGKGSDLAAEGIAEFTPAVPASVMPQPGGAVARNAHASSVTAPSRHAPRAAGSTVAAVRSEASETSRAAGAARATRAAPGLLLSIREFVPVPAVVPAYPENAPIAEIRMRVQAEAVNGG